jgi:hypothetical protein
VVPNRGVAVREVVLGRDFGGDLWWTDERKVGLSVDDISKTCTGRCCIIPDGFPQEKGRNDCVPMS